MSPAQQHGVASSGRRAARGEVQHLLRGARAVLVHVLVVDLSGRRLVRRLVLADRRQLGEVVRLHVRVSEPAAYTRAGIRSSTVRTL